ncbi:DUF6932 family protein [Spirosoma aerophilum]
MAKHVDYWFDKHGNLAPYTFISVDDLVDFEKRFVADFVQSTTRQTIFTGLLEYLGDVGMLLTDLSYKGTWRVWLNGSFTTQRLNPNDVDLLNVFDNDSLFEQHKSQFEPLFAGNASARYGVDAYFLLTDNSDRTTELTNYWQQQFGTDRNGRAKGIINLEILFG